MANNNPKPFEIDPTPVEVDAKLSSFLSDVIEKTEASKEPSFNDPASLMQTKPEGVGITDPVPPVKVATSAKVTDYHPVAKQIKKAPKKAMAKKSASSSTSLPEGCNRLFIERLRELGDNFAAQLFVTLYEQYPNNEDGLRAVEALRGKLVEYGEASKNSEAMVDFDWTTQELRATAHMVERTHAHNNIEWKSRQIFKDHDSEEQEASAAYSAHMKRRGALAGIGVFLGGALFAAGRSMSLQQKDSQWRESELVDHATETSELVEGVLKETKGLEERKALVKQLKNNLEASETLRQNHQDRVAKSAATPFYNREGGYYKIGGSIIALGAGLSVLEAWDAARTEYNNKINPLKKNHPDLGGVVLSEKLYKVKDREILDLSLVKLLDEVFDVVEERWYEDGYKANKNAWLRSQAIAAEPAAQPAEPTAPLEKTVTASPARDTVHAPEPESKPQSVSKGVPKPSIIEEYWVKAQSSGNVDLNSRPAFRLLQRCQESGGMLWAKNNKLVIKMPENTTAEQITQNVEFLARNVYVGADLPIHAAIITDREGNDWVEFSGATVPKLARGLAHDMGAFAGSTHIPAETASEKLSLLWQAEVTPGIYQGQKIYHIPGDAFPEEFATGRAQYRVALEDYEQAIKSVLHHANETDENAVQTFVTTSGGKLESVLLLDRATIDRLHENHSESGKSWLDSLAMGMLQKSIIENDKITIPAQESHIARIRDRRAQAKSNTNLPPHA